MSHLTLVLVVVGSLQVLVRTLLEGVCLGTSQPPEDWERDWEPVSEQVPEDLKQSKQNQTFLTARALTRQFRLKVCFLFQHKNGMRPAGSHQDEAAVERLSACLTV